MIFFHRMFMSPFIWFLSKKNRGRNSRGYFYTWYMDTTITGMNFSYGDHSVATTNSSNRKRCTFSLQLPLRRKRNKKIRKTKTNAENNYIRRM